MRKLLSLCALIVLALSPAIAMAADISGTWTGAMRGPDGNVARGERPKPLRRVEPIGLDVGRIVEKVGAA